MVKRMIDRTINRKEKKLMDDVLGILKSSENPRSTAEIASLLDVSWHSIQTRCLRLQVAGKLTGFRAGRMNLWAVKNE